MRPSRAPAARGANPYSVFAAHTGGFFGLAREKDVDEVQEDIEKRTRDMNAFLQHAQQKMDERIDGLAQDMDNYRAETSVNFLKNAQVQAKSFSATLLALRHRHEKLRHEKPVHESATKEWNHAHDLSSLKSELAALKSDVFFVREGVNLLRLKDHGLVTYAHGSFDVSRSIEHMIKHIISILDTIMHDSQEMLRFWDPRTTEKKGT